MPWRFREKGHWWWAKFWMKRYCQLFSQEGSFRVDAVKGMGLGIIARKDLKKGSRVLFGHLHRISNKTAVALDKVGEMSMLQIRRSKQRVDWYYLGGPASLLNHACKKFNAEFVLDKAGKRGAQGEMCIRLLRNVGCGEEILVHYGDEFWSQNSCYCEDCRQHSNVKGSKKKKL